MRRRSSTTWPGSMPATSSLRRWRRWASPKRSPGLRSRSGMMISRRRFGAIALGASSMVGIGAALADVATEPGAVVQSLYDALLDAMKQGEQLGFDGRYQKLEPVIHK